MPLPTDISWAQSTAWEKKRPGTSGNSTEKAISAIRAARLLRRPAATRTSCSRTILTWMKSRRCAPPGNFFEIAGRSRMARFPARKRRREQMQPIEKGGRVYMGNGRSDEIVRKHKEFIWPAVTNYYQKPLVADHASMQYLWDIEGNKYLDFFGGIVTIGVGHCNPKVTSKIKEQVDKLQHTSTLFPNEHMVALAEKLSQITPGKLQKSFFTSSGTEANEAALLLSRMISPSYDVVSLRHAYSGGSALAKSVTAQAPWRKSGVISVGVSHAVNPYCYRCPLHLKYPECGVACANDVESTIQTTTGGSIAAFIAEPIQGVGGFITPPPEYFKIVYRIVKNYGGLFIADEVQTGWGRTGKKWWGIEQWEVTPDIITSAKSMGNGVPVGLTITTAELADKFQGLTISTFGGNPVTAVAVRAVIEVIEEENLR